MAVWQIFSLLKFVSGCPAVTGARIQVWIRMSTPGSQRFVSSRTDVPSPELENQSLLENLTLLGVDVKMARRRQPGVLRKALTNEHGLARFLGGKGASREVVASIISRFPRAITRSEEHLEERWRMWRSVFPNDAEVVRIVHRSPESFFRSSDNHNLERNIAFLSSLGITPKELRRLLTTAPRAFSNSLALNRSMVQLLEDICASLGGQDCEDFARDVVSRNVYVLIRSAKRVKANVEFLLSALESSQAEALALLRGPGTKILDLSHESLKRNLRSLRRKLETLGCSKAEFKRLLLDSPQVLFLSSATLDHKLDCLVEGGVGVRQVVEKPKVLEFSVDTLKQRLDALQALGYDFRANGIAVLDMSKKRFEARLEKLKGGA